MPQACRNGDPHADGCVNTSGSPNVFINLQEAHRVGDIHSHIPPPSQAEGSPNVYVNGRPLARVGDVHAWFSPQTGGSPNVYINGG